MDVTQFKIRFLPCHPKMYRVAWRLTGNEQEAEDLVQDTFLKLWIKRDTLLINGSVEAYCITTLKNLYFDQRRKSNPRTTDIAEEQVHHAYDGSLDGTLEAKADSAIVIGLIDKLPERQRQIITLKDVEEMDYEEIVKQTGLTSANVRVLLSRARKQIRQQWKEITDYGCK